MIKNFKATNPSNTAITNLKYFCGTLVTIVFAINAPDNEIGIANNRIKIKFSGNVVPLVKYFIILVISIKRATIPEVKMYISLGKLKADKKAPRTAPPTPKMPAKKPDNDPPMIDVRLLAGIFQDCFRKR